MSEIKHGIVRRFGSKGYGFIQPNDGGPEIFVHALGVADRDRILQAGDQVSYQERKRTHKGVDSVVAGNVRVLAGRATGNFGTRGHLAVRPSPSLPT